MSFNFNTLADAEKAQADKAAQCDLMGWDKIKKPGANQAPQALTPEVTPVVDSGPIVVKPKRKAK